MNFDDPLSVVIDRLDNHADRISRLEEFFEKLLDIQGLDAEVQIDIGDPMENTFKIRLQNIVFYHDGKEYRSNPLSQAEQVAHHE